KTVEAYIQNCVSRLRRVLGAELIERRSPGYVLRVEPGRIDAHRFEQAVAAAASIAPLERSTALREALALWHGPALADLAFERLAALERQIIAQDPSLSGAPDEPPSGDEPSRRAVMLAFELTAEGERDRAATLAEIELVVAHYGGSLAGESLAFFATHDDDV